MNVINILLIVSIVLLLCILCSRDHFKPINSLNIKYNADNIIKPNRLVKPTSNELSIKEQISAELKNTPLMFENQLYSMAVYPNVGEKELCLDNSDCSMLTAKCNHDIFDRNLGIGMCTLAVPDKTVFNIKY